MDSQRDSALIDVTMIGLGPVGVVSGLCFAKQGFSVVGVDIDQQRVDALNAGRVPFIEPETPELLQETRSSQRFRATTELKEIASRSRVIMIAVGTPTGEGQAPDVSALKQVAAVLGESFAEQAPPQPPVIVLRSTVPPGTLRSVLAPLITETSGLTPGRDFFLAANPEFLREGTAVKDFFHTSRIVIGAEHQEAAEGIKALYRDVDAPCILTDIETAEFAKFVDNSWHALKVAFGNEIGRMVASFGGNLEDTTRIFLSDHHLNLSAKYLTPGGAFGGSCLPKDVRGLQWLAQQNAVNLPVINAIMPSNEAHITRLFEQIMTHNPRIVGLLGLAFKTGLDDLREAPALMLVDKLLAAGIEVLAHDFQLNEKTVTLPSGAGLHLASLASLTQHADLMVRYHSLPDYEESNFSQPVLDSHHIL